MKITELQRSAYKHKIITALKSVTCLEEWAHIGSKEFAYNGIEDQHRLTAVSWLGRGKGSRISQIRLLYLEALRPIFRSMDFDDVLLASMWLLSIMDNHPKELEVEPVWQIDNRSGKRFYHPSSGGRWGRLSGKLFEDQHFKLIKWDLNRVKWLLCISSKYDLAKILLDETVNFNDCYKIWGVLHTGQIGGDVFLKLCSLASNADDHFMVASMAKRLGFEDLWWHHVLRCTESL